MKKMNKRDLIAIGRSSIDLYSQDIGVPFKEISGFNAFVGGSPLNISVGCSRLGLKSTLLTAVGKDKVGEFILNFLNKENVNTELIPTKENGRCSAVLLGIEPPDKFPLLFYRDNAADTLINIDDVNNANIANHRVLLVNGTALNKEPSRGATIHAIEIAKKNSVTVVMDLDFRADQWDDYRSFGHVVKSIISKVDITIGTEEEVLASMLKDSSQVTIKHQQISSPEIKGNINKSIKELIKLGTDILIVKKGKDGASYFDRNFKRKDVKGYPVKILNVLGAGDAFASGFIYGIIQKWCVEKSIKMGNACGSHVVTKEGCANFMPTLEEALKIMSK